MEILIKDKFWLQNPSILYQRNRLVEFIPLKDFTLEETLNSLMRFSIYSTLLMFIFFDEWRLLLFPFFMSGITIYFYYSHRDYYTFDREPVTLCHETNANNPMMNLLVTDYAYDPDRKEACDYKHATQEIRQNLDNGRYQNNFDILDTDAYERQWYTMPSTTIPNDQESFANWLYKEQDTCKTNIESCKVNDDIRSDREKIYRS
jgi:hypothetical protein